jgi:hypothetical protein
MLVNDEWVFMELFDGPLDPQILNPLDFFIFIGNFRDNVYLTPPGTQKELKKRVVRVCQEKPRNFLQNAKVGISRRYRQCLQQH